MRFRALRLSAALLAASLSAGCGSAGTSGGLPNAGEAPAGKAFGNAAIPRNFQPRGQSKIGYGWTDLRGVAVDEKTKIVYVLNRDELKKIDPVTGTVTTVASGFFAPSNLAVDSSSHVVYVAEPLYPRVRAVFPNGTISSIGSGFSLPYSVAVDSTNHVVYVGDIGTHEVWVLPPTAHPQQIFARGIDAHALSINPDSGELYAADSELNSVYIIGARAIIPIGSQWIHPRGVAFDVRTHHVYVSDVRGAWDLAPDGSKTAVGNGINFASAIADDSETNRLYVIGQAENAVYRITNAASDKVLDFSKFIGFNFSGVAVDAGTGDLYVGFSLNDNFAIYKVTAKDDSRIYLRDKVIPSPPSQYFLAYDSSTHDLYYLLQWEGTIHKITPSGSDTAIAGDFRFATSFAIDSSSHDLYVGLGDRVNKVAPNGTITQFEKGVFPFGIAVDPRSHDVYVSDLLIVRKYSADGKIAKLIYYLTPPVQLAFDPQSGVLYVQVGDNNLKAVAPDGTITTIGTDFNHINSLAVYPLDGSVYVASQSKYIWKFVP